MKQPKRLSSNPWLSGGRRQLLAMACSIDQIDSVLAEANRLRNATAKLSIEYKSHAGLKRELDAQSRMLQVELDRFVRHSAEETHQLAYGLTTVRGEIHSVEHQIALLDRACCDMERLCQDARLKRDRLALHLQSVKADTFRTMAGMDEYSRRTKENVAPLEERLIDTLAELRTLASEASSLRKSVAGRVGVQ